MKILILILFCLVNVSCATLDNTAVIEKTVTGVEFTTSRSCEMSMKEGETEYTYNSQTESLTSKIISILTLGAIGAR